MKIPACTAINPKTGKPYSRHKYDNRVSVGSYVGSFSTGMRPATYIISRKCERCGFIGKSGSY